VTIGPSASLATAAKVLAERWIGALVVMDSADRVAGVLSERDVVRALAERGPDALHESLDRAMTRRVITCTGAMTISEVMERMTIGKFRHLSVVELGPARRHCVDRRRCKIPAGRDATRIRIDA
jgi:CBS domain-containing protein